MSSEMVISLAERGVYTTLMIAGPLLILALGIGLLVSVFQATTQIQEQTLAFIPKIVAVLVGLVVFGPWMLQTLLAFAGDIFSNLHQFTG
ncbi:flagellar biosynthesis protein FliQ [Alteribacter natronophilus]|uniref:flagellar biosynthesis protein FliQ n=1 Tax=Alteribacter natronophilus TaxID=2583810 RepID=UPI00110E53DD|nr:flagellar biosynthesis protein FliQ [Alteribacter natronophilus]TMW73226.1 flagellar biosynthesis protein FliQ [Alteribacter natronophilus]